MAKHTVGERVVAARSLPRYGINKGETVEVIEVDAPDADLTYRICRKNGQRAWVHSSVIEDTPIDPTPTIRDQFAMAALSGLMSRPIAIPYADIAKHAYTAADAVLAAREAG